MMSRSLSLLKILTLLVLFAIAVPAHAQFGNFNPGNILNKAKKSVNDALHGLTGATTGQGMASADAPANDNFAQRAQLTGMDCTATVDNTYATADASDPILIPDNQDYRTVWWTWTAPATGWLEIDTLGGVSRVQDTALGIYVGDAPASLVPVARDNDETDHFKMVFPVAAGQTYQIMSAGLQGPFDGHMGFNLHLTPKAIPAPVVGMDNFADRAALKGSECMAVADNVQYTTDASDPVVSPGWQSLRSAWWTWTAPATGKVTIDTLGGVSSVQNTVLGVYLGNAPDVLIPVTQKDGETNGYQIAFPVAAGQTYQIMSAAPQGVYVGEMGFNLHFAAKMIPAPVLGGDAFENRGHLKGSSCLAVADNIQATVEEGEPIHTAGMENARTVWWTWTAPATGRATIDTDKIGGDAQSAYLTIYTGASLDNLAPMLRSRSLPEGASLVFQTTAGETYQIVSNGGNGGVGFNLHFAPNALPPTVVGQDNFDDRAHIPGDEATAIANNELATIESGEPDHTPNQRDAHTVWWSWTAPAKGRVSLDTIKSGSSIQVTALAVYTGDTLDSLAPVAHNAANTDGYALIFPVSAGRTYQIAANGYDGSCIGQVAFNLRFASSKLSPSHLLPLRRHIKPKQTSL